MGETAADASTASKPKPTILVPPRGSTGFLFSSGSPPGFSPGPMTLLSSFFPEQGPFSFSQLLAGAMASPLAPKPTPSDCNFSTDGKNRDTGCAGPLNSSTPTNFAASPPQSLSPLFMVPPGLSPNSSGYLSPLQSPFGMSHQQALAHVTAQAAMSQSFKQMQAHLHHSSYNDGAEEPLKQTNPLPPQPQSSKITEPSEASQSEKGGGNKSGSSDGYNWRKYGQKHVKTSECPRGYYKCTHLNCPVKKKVEHSSDGGITEVTYKGQHNHDPPKPNKRGKDSCGASDRIMNSKVQTATDRLDEVVVPVHTEPANHHHPVANNNDGKEDRDSAVVVYEGNGSDEPIAKKRSLDVEPSISSSSHKTSGESKIVLQTRSEVDLLNDGYKWRKYGQKVVKGNPHPRSYYRCTYAGCNVRKHVERASADPAAVITTYEGKHNHEIPMGRYSHGSVNPQPSKTQKMVSEKPSLSKEIDYGNQDQAPITLQLKDEQIAT